MQQPFLHILNQTEFYQMQDVSNRRAEMSRVSKSP